MLQEKYDTNLLERTKALANHLYYRLNRIDKSSVEIEKITQLQKEFDNQYTLLAKFVQPSTSNTTVIPEYSNVNQSVNQGGLTSEPASSDRCHILDLQKLKFNCKSCVHVFIQRVNEFCTSRSLSNKKATVLCD